jgi:hypothetical protein
MEAAGKRVPADFCPQVFFFTFQFARTCMLASSPIRVRELEQWAWMDGRWVLADASDMSKSSDFLHILSKADELSAPSPKTCGGSQAYWFNRRCVRRYTSCCCALRRFALVLSQTWSRQASAYRACGTCTRNSPSSAASTLPNALPYLGS